MKSSSAMHQITLQQNVAFCSHDILVAAECNDRYPVEEATIEIVSGMFVTMPKHLDTRRLFIMIDAKVVPTVFFAC